MTAGMLQATDWRLREGSGNTNASHLVDSPLGEFNRGTLEQCSCDGMELGHGVKYSEQKKYIYIRGTSSFVQC